MTSPDTLKALAAELREIESSTIFNNKGDGNSITQAAAILESLASADEGVPVVAWLLLDQGCRAPDDCEEFERVELASEIKPSELARFQAAGRAEGLVTMAGHLAALSAQSTAEDEVAVALSELLEWFDPHKWGSTENKAQAIESARAALAAHEAKHGGKG